MNPATARSKRIRNRVLIPLDNVRTRLAVVWLGGAGAFILLVAVQSLLGRYAARTQEAWGWLLPTIMPTLGLIVTVLGYTALDPIFSRSVVRKTFFHIAFGLSVLYIALILLTVLIQPFAAHEPEKAVELMHTSSIWLAPMQGLVDSALGVLFISKKDSSSND